MHLYGCKNYDFKFTVSYGATVCLEPKQRRWCSGIMQDSHSCDPGSIPGRRRISFFEYIFGIKMAKKCLQRGLNSRPLVYKL